MAAPPEVNGYSTYFITASTFQKQCLFESERFAIGLLETILQYRLKRKYLLHEFVILPDQFHLLITPALTLDKAVQFVKGGFCYRAGKELGYGGEIWQPGYRNHPIRDVQEYDSFRHYIWQKPVKRGLARIPEDYPFSSAFPGFGLDEVPERLRLSA